MDKETKKIICQLTHIIIILSIIVSAGGIFMTTIYNDNDFIKIVWRSNDLLTLILIVPIMVLTLIMYKKGQDLAYLIWMGTLGYMIYNYVFYLYGAAFNKFFLIYVALFILSTYSLILMLVKIDIDRYRKWFSNKVPNKKISIFMFSFVLILGGLWIGIAISYVFTNVVPPQIVQTGHPTSVVFATDLSLLIAGMLISGLMLWKNNIWGYVFSSIVLFKASAYGLVLIVMTFIVYIETGVKDPILPLYIFLWLGSLLSFVTLLKKDRRNKGVII